MTGDDSTQIKDRRELAKMAAISRTKVVHRKKLSDGKEDQSGIQRNQAARRSNMLCFTGDEANGLQVSPSTVTTMAFFFIGGMVLLHMFGSKFLGAVKLA